jgi:hypothetical protein
LRSGRRASNPRPSAWEADPLPVGHSTLSNATEDTGRAFQRKTSSRPRAECEILDLHRLVALGQPPGGHLRQSGPAELTCGRQERRLPARSLHPGDERPNLELRERFSLAKHKKARTRHADTDWLGSTGYGTTGGRARFRVCAQGAHQRLYELLELLTAGSRPRTTAPSVAQAPMPPEPDIPYRHLVAEDHLRFRSLAHGAAEDPLLRRPREPFPAAAAQRHPAHGTVARLDAFNAHLVPAERRRESFSRSSAPAWMVS